MIDRLAPIWTFIHHHSIALLQAQISSTFLANNHQMPQKAFIIIIYCRNLGYRFLGYHQKMCWCLRGNVMESETLVILINDLAGISLRMIFPKIVSLPGWATWALAISSAISASLPSSQPGRRSGGGGISLKRTFPWIFPRNRSIKHSGHFFEWKIFDWFTTNQISFLKEHSDFYYFFSQFWEVTNSVWLDTSMFTNFSDQHLAVFQTLF